MEALGLLASASDGTGVVAHAGVWIGGRVGPGFGGGAESAQTRWRAVNSPHLVALVRAGAKFEKGKLVGRTPDESGGDQQVA